jgi:hypothetical protein
MKKLYVKKVEEVLTTSEPTLFCGFVDDLLTKGWLATIGDNCFKPLFFKEFTNDNAANGFYTDNQYTTVEQFLNCGLTDSSRRVTKIFFFDSLKELYKWLVTNEDLND